MHLIVGLGNPGQSYAKTRHNVGFMAADVIIRRYAIESSGKRFDGEVYRGVIHAHSVLIFKPSTYMNLSGVAVSKVMQFYKIPLDHVIVIYDDLDLALGKIKMKIGGGSAGHNGIKSLDAHIGSNYHRLRFGIGRSVLMDTSAYVLQSFSEEEQNLVTAKLESIAEEIPTLLESNSQQFLNQLALRMTAAPTKG